MERANNFSRRAFVKKACLVGASFALATGKKTTAVQAAPKASFKVGGFTKNLQELSYDETAEAASEIGWDCIECPVRPGGHVLPKRVEDDLPKMVEALQKRGLELSIMATNIHNLRERHTESVLRTASRLGVKYYRLGYWEYNDSQPIDKQLNEIKAQLRELAGLNRELGICGVFQNHCGSESVGAAVWDVYELLKGLDAEYMGSHFDIGHATVEGGYAWRIHFRRIEQFIRAVVVKDFRWAYENGHGEVRWCPLGKGMISPEFFEMLRESGFCGPVTIHFEYDVEDEGKQHLKNLIQAMKKDTQVLRKWLAG